MTRIYPQTETDKKIAYNRGKTAKEKHFARISCYYENPAADRYWFAGYDGVKFENIDVVTTHPTPNNITS